MNAASGPMRAPRWRRCASRRATPRRGWRRLAAERAAIEAKLADPALYAPDAQGGDRRRQCARWPRSRELAAAAEAEWLAAEEALEAAS